MDKSVDELAAYLAYALRILKNCDLPCEGITTPGGFGNKVKDKLPLAVFEAVRDVYGTDLPHYFKYVHEGDQSTEPRLEGLRDEQSDQPRVTVNVPAGTGDWFGGWDGDRQSEGYKYATDDASSGRMVELIERGQPAVMLCHWPGMYCNGSEQGYQHFQRVVLALADRYSDRTRWMKVSDIGRYWTAKALTKVEPMPHGMRFKAPFMCSMFTVRLAGKPPERIVWKAGQVADASGIELKRVKDVRQLNDGPGFWIDGTETVVCFHLQRGENWLQCS